MRWKRLDLLRRLLVGLTLMGVAMVAGAQAADFVPPSRNSRIDVFLDMQPDGRSVQTARRAILINTDGGARTEAQQKMSFIDGISSLRFTGHTLKADGRRIPVADSAIRIQRAAGTPSLPAYHETREMVAVFPDVAAGDTLEFEWVLTNEEPALPGHFSRLVTYPRTMAWDDASFAVSVPQGMHVSAEAVGPVGSVEQVGDRTLYRWRYAAPAVAADPAALSSFDRAPRILVSSFPSWPAMAEAMARRIASMHQPSPEIVTLAADITRGMTDRRAEVQAIADWVARHVRWVAMYLGNGGYIPHDAPWVVANRYGDCKDQVMLLVALLSARGIAAEPVITSLLIASYALNATPTIQVFDHMITYVPELDVYVDTTTGVAPVGTVHWTMSGKPALHLAAGRDIRRLPLTKPGGMVSALRTEATLGADGFLSGRTVNTGAGMLVPQLRVAGIQISSTGEDRFAAGLLAVRRLSGTAHFTTLPSPEPLGELEIAGTFRLSGYTGALEGDALPLPTGLWLLERIADGPLGPLFRTIPDQEAVPCFAADQREDLSLALPEGYRPDRLPRAVRIDHPNLSYDSTWAFENGTLSVARVLHTRGFDLPLCDAPLRRALAPHLAAIRRDLVATVRLEKAD